MIGGNYRGIIVTYMDKASKFLVAGLAKNKTASEINRVTEKLFQEIHPDKRKTFTCDKVKEFCGHQELSQKLGADFYFTTSYHSWERGLNEHTNGLLRQFFAKRTNLKILKPEQVERAVSSGRYKQAAYPKSDGKDALWSPSYFVSSVGGVPLAVLKCYIRDQEKLS